MAKKSKLLTEIGEIMKEAPINIDEFNVEILRALSRKFLYLNDERE